MATKHQRNRWFKKVRGSYLPCSWQGVALYALYAAYIIGIVVYVVVQGYDRLLAVFLVFPNWAAALVIMTWIAERLS